MLQFNFSQSNSLTNRVIGKLQTNGSVEWRVSKNELKLFLQNVLNKMGYKSIISENSVTIYYVNLHSSYFIFGEGHESEDNSSESRVIRVELETIGNGNLKIKKDGVVEECIGNNCEYCAFAPEGGCVCKRTKESPTGVNGTCNHIIKKLPEIIGEN